MLRVVHVVPGLAIGGAERSLERLLQAGLARATDAHVVSLGPDGPMRAALEASGATVSFRSGSTISLIGHLSSQIARLRPNIVQGWMYHANLAASALAVTQRNWPSVFWNVRQSLSAPERDRVLTRAIIRASGPFSWQPAGIIYNSYLARSQHEAIGYRKSLGVVIANGFATASGLSQRTDGAALRDALAIPKEALVVAHVGRYHAVKDHQTFVTAAVQLAQARPHVRYVLAGRDVVAANTELVATIPVALRDRFSFLGEREDIPAVLAASDIFALSSVAEAFPNALGEAMAAACACVATDVGDVHALLEGAGIIVPPVQPDLLAQAMQKFVDDPGLRKQSGLAASLRIERDYALDAAVARYISLYESAAAPGRTIR